MERFQLIDRDLLLGAYILRTNEQQPRRASRCETYVGARLHFTRALFVT